MGQKRSFSIPKVTWRYKKYHFGGRSFFAILPEFRGKHKALRVVSVHFSRTNFCSVRDGLSQITFACCNQKFFAVRRSAAFRTSLSFLIRVCCARAVVCQSVRSCDVPMHALSPADSFHNYERKPHARESPEDLLRFLCADSFLRPVSKPARAGTIQRVDFF